MTRFATILDIAEQVGLSHMTVSRALSGKGSVRETTRRRVLEAAEQLNYSPNTLASGFRSGQTRSAGIVWQFVDPWGGDTAVGLWVMQALQRRGLACYPSQLVDDIPLLLKTLDRLLARRVDAVVIGAPADLLRHQAVMLRLERVPCVTVVTPEAVEGVRGDLIVHDRNIAIRQVVQHLAATGRKRPAFFTSLEVQSNHVKLATFKEACVACGIAPHPHLLLPIRRRPEPTLQQPFGTDLDRYQEALEEAFPQGQPVDVDAIFTFNDLGAMASCKFVAERGMRVPDDVAIVGFNNDPAGAVWQPPLATGDRRRAELAKAVEEMVFSRLRTPGLKPRSMTIEMQFLWRASAGGKMERRV